MIRLAFVLALFVGFAHAQSQAELVPMLKALPKAKGKRAESSTRSGLPELFTAGVLELKKRSDVPLDKVFALYSREAQAGDAVAQASLARLYANGVGTSQDKAQAFAWAQKAADQGNPGAQTLLGNWLLKGDGVPSDNEAAYRWYRKAADQGEPIAEYMVGWLEVYGQGTRQDIADGQRWSVKAANDGMDDALSILVSSLPRDSGKRAASSTRSKLPPLSWWGAKTLKERPDLADMIPLILASYRRDAEAGDAVAQYSMSQLYALGVGVPLDLDKARDWASKSAESGYALGELQFGMLHDNDMGSAKDLAEAYRWYRKAAEAGDPAAQFNVAVALRDGRGVAQDKKEALEWLRKAAAADLPNAAGELSAWYEAGTGGLDKDPQEALRWQRKAAELGDPNAEVFLGHRYAFGIGGVGVDLKKAVELYRKAAVLLKAPREEELRKDLVQAQAAIREKNFAEAQDILNKARNLAPWSDAVWYNVALVYAENQNFSGAIDQMQVFLALAPDSPQARGAQDLIYEWERKVPARK
ncbi:MAG TPA: tetratricopeptide repeat protein [Burkholderiales bacterium]|nr:tetratricopeptide repeat protein [Burkholderiales bacterium]